jgi:hypothetical protein
MARQERPWRDDAEDDVSPDWDGGSIAGTIGGAIEQS